MRDEVVSEGIFDCQSDSRQQPIDSLFEGEKNSAPENENFTALYTNGNTKLFPFKHLTKSFDTTD